MLFSDIQSWNPWLVGALLSVLLGLLTWPILKKLLTPSGLLHAWILGVLIWGTLGWSGYAVIVFYFIAGSAVTKVGMAEKEAAGIAEKRSGARGPENVWGSALAGTLCSLATLIADERLRSLLLLGYVASLSTKLSDTSASEIGKAYGKHTFLITTLKAVPRGTEGAISWEGTLAGIVGSILIACVGWAVGLISPFGIGICAAAAFVATNFESLIGATLQHRFDWLTNELVNVINTLIGAISAIGIGWFLIRFV